MNLFAVVIFHFAWSVLITRVLNNALIEEKALRMTCIASVKHLQGYYKTIKK